jgi:hypothetical protein
MKKALSLIFAVVLAMTMSLTAFATVENGKILNGTPVVDGVLDDIYTQSAHFVCDMVAVYPWGNGDLANESPANAYFLWDADYLYICIVGVDNTPFSDPEKSWMNDAAEMWFSDEGLKFKVHAAADGTFFLGTDGDAKVAWTAGFDASKSVAVQTDEGWVVEVALPMNNLAAGKTFDFTLQVNNVYDSEKANGIAVGSQDPTNTFECVADQVTLPEAETEAPAETEAVVEEAVEETVVAPVETAPQTFDAGIIAAVCAVVSAAGYAVAKKH